MVIFIPYALHEMLNLIKNRIVHRNVKFEIAFVIILKYLDGLFKTIDFCTSLRTYNV